MMKRFLIILSFIMALTTSCERKLEEKGVEPPEYDLTFQGITYTDADGALIGELDPDDWKNNTVWPYGEIARSFGFNELPTGSPNHQPGPLETKYDISAAFPNPSSDTVTIICTLPRDSNVFMAIIDERLTLVRTLANGHVQAGYHYVMWDLKNDSGELVHGDIYRCIYMAWYLKDEEEVIAYQSYGDIWVQ